jgi:hypothetical protein
VAKEYTLCNGKSDYIRHPLAAWGMYNKNSLLNIKIISE